MIVLGLTGSIGMGKSTTAGMFRAFGIPVHDSDEAVHRLYRGEAVPLVEEAFPQAVREGVVDRDVLGRLVLADPQALKRLESIIHPLVRRDADAFIARNRAAGASLVVLDIPLLFETGGEARVDRIAVVTASTEVQRDRVLSRAGMTEAKFAIILAKQVPDAEKRRRADFIIDTGKGLDHARQIVGKIVDQLTGLGTVRGN